MEVVRVEAPIPGMEAPVKRERVAAELTLTMELIRKRGRRDMGIKEVPMGDKGKKKEVHMGDITRGGKIMLMEHTRGGPVEAHMGHT